MEKRGESKALRAIDWVILIVSVIVIVGSTVGMYNRRRSDNSRSSHSYDIGARRSRRKNIHQGDHRRRAVGLRNTPYRS